MPDDDRRGGVAVFEAVLGFPPPGLRPYVERYVGYHYSGFPPGLHRGVPGANMTLIVSFGDPVDIIGMPGDSQSPARLAAFVGGLSTGPALIRHEGDQRGVALDLTPLGARVTVGRPAAALASVVVDLGDVWGRIGAVLPERLAAAPTWAERFALLDDALLRCAHNTPGPAPEVTQAWATIVGSGGRIGIGSVAAEVGWSRRHLGTRFRAEFGITPKAAARVVRFDRALDLIAGRPEANLADLAAEAGFYDQSHLTRDFHDLAGCAPGTWLADELPSPRSEAAPV